MSYCILVSSRKIIFVVFIYTSLLLLTLLWYINVHVRSPNQSNMYFCLSVVLSPLPNREERASLPSIGTFLDKVSGLLDELQSVLSGKPDTRKMGVDVSSINKFSNNVTTIQSPCSHGNIDSVVLVKTHKTASSTIGSIIGRYGVERNLSFALPRDSNSMFGDVPFNSAMLLSSPGNGGFHLLISHVPFNRTAIQDVMKPDVKYVTILRDPVAQFYSGVHFFKLKDFFNISKDIYAPDFDIKAFLRRISECDAYACKVIYNGQMFDLGLFTNTFNDMSIATVEARIKEIEDALDLVLIQEYFDESLILFQKLMCWEFKDIIYFSQKVRKNRFTPPKEHAAIIRSWNYADTILFKHFNESLWEKISRYGPSFELDLKNFRQLNLKTSKLCNEKIKENQRNVAKSRRKNRRSTRKEAKGQGSDENVLCAHLQRDVYTYTKLLREIEMSRHLKS